MSPEKTRSDKLDTDWLLLLGAWLIATGASLGSLFFSEIMELPPCSLCWYQRVFMFPLVVVLSTGLLPFDLKVARYALPLSALGTVVAIYHVLLQAEIIPESAAPCTQGVSCSDVDLLVFGFASIPVLSLIAFCVITCLLLALFRRSSR